MSQKTVTQQANYVAKQCESEIFNHRSIRVYRDLANLSDRGPTLTREQWREKQQLWRSYLRKFDAETKTSKLKATPKNNIHLKAFSPTFIKTIQDRIDYLIGTRNGHEANEAEWSRLWEKYFCPLPQFHISGHTMRLLEDRTTRVVFESGALVESRYPPVVPISDKEDKVSKSKPRRSVTPSKKAWEYYCGARRGTSGHAFSDISYRIDIREWLESLPKEQQLRFPTLPLARIYQDTRYLPSLECYEVKHWSRTSAEGLTSKAVNYLALGAAIKMHERLKLCWMGRPTKLSGRQAPYMQLPSDLYFHNFALVGCEAHHYVCQIRPFSNEEIGEPVKYEAVFQEKYDLNYDHSFDILRTTLNKIRRINYILGRPILLAEFAAALASPYQKIPDQTETFWWNEEGVLVIGHTGSELEGIQQDLPELEQCEIALYERHNNKTDSDDEPNRQSRV
ncbi:hypothetical protein MMC13_007198 [Lambiella insularis]|nr:hypothetical protein [Lambiella insularis]